MYSISGYFHISSNLQFQDLISKPALEEWLDSHRYFMKLCPSNAEEMVKIGLLCYGSVFHFRKDLKQAILSHPSWSPSDPDNPPVFDLFVGELNSSSKKVKMMFVSAEKSKQEKVSHLFRTIYDGTQKSYPNGSMMLFVPISDLYHSSVAFRAKLQFNHEKFLGDETLFLYWWLSKSQQHSSTKKRKIDIHSSITQEYSSFGWYVPPPIIPTGRT